VKPKYVMFLVALMLLFKAPRQGRRLPQRRTRGTPPPVPKPEPPLPTVTHDGESHTLH